ncbi:PR domain zinc finger protein 5-like isoform X5 [Leptidea sinapis]|uniref:PR domain zinc finger protein 5-like isoform X5 n=1 Tax=Leptidea sinapis TaxID=189913 RepID=UPI0021C399EC|nr:PR domain zinc finger protein 5-like isoform X5 [Leptidea sinapis]
MESNFSDSMCRCCASEGVFKDFNSTYQWMGAEEVYADMLKDCFDITLTVSETINSGGICEVCITQLRNAFNFKKQVQYTEEQFKRKIEEMKFKTEIVKVEEAGEDDFPSDHNLSDDDFSSPEYDIPIIKMESSSESAKSKKRATKGATTRSKKAKTEDGETSAKRSPDNTDSRESDNVSGSWNKTGAITINLRGDAQVRDITKHRHNARQFIQLSNATPIRYQASMGFVCCFCYEQFHDPADLKSHTMNDHDDKCKLKFMSGKSISTYIVKMDITNLQCKLCAENLIDIDALTKHLITVHNKKVYTDVKSYIVPFKFETEDLRCCMCSQVFSRLKALQEHMNVHMRNYTCEICDAGFLNQKMLKNHMEGHESGSFKCDFCENVYASMKIKKLHERNVHTRPKLINKCGACYEMFTSYRAKERHLRTAHGIINNRLKCSACEKLFPNPNALRVHIKRDHLLERRYKCTMCDMGFFLKSELNGHLVKHSGDKSYQCEICNKSYGRKKTLREHIRIHLNDRRFKCKFCDKAFVQKCSWRSHMRTKHGKHVSLVRIC